ncbi:MAG: ATP synthase F1 subunit epsilon [Spirochaetota bacterium]|nr:ATP synthase F1 subunit epsilon [Spirochaetota bacterium]
MKCKLVTPDKLIFDGEVSSVNIPALNGAMGILPGHAPIVTTLGKGVLQIQSTTTTTEYNVEGGFAEVRANVISILANTAEKIV